MAEGIRKLHSAKCASRGGGRCGCQGGYEASVYSPRDGRKIRKTFPTITAAKAWRVDALAGVRRGSVRAPRPATVREAAEELLRGMESGVVRTRSGDVYKPSAVRSYEAALRVHVLPELGPRKLADVQRRDVQRLADEDESVHRLMNDILQMTRPPSALRDLSILARAMAKARDEKIVRFLGISGHYSPFVLKKGIEQYPFDSILMALNAADKHNASFIDNLLPAAVEKGIAIVRSVPGAEAIIVDREGRVHVTPGLAGKVEGLAS